MKTTCCYCGDEFEINNQDLEAIKQGIIESEGIEYLEDWMLKDYIEDLSFCCYECLEIEND